MSRQHSIIARYNQKLYQNPLLVKCLTGAALSSIGELISQCTTIAAQSTADVRSSSSPEKEGKKTTMKVSMELHLSKVLAMSCYGGLINAPINHYMYKWITNITNKKIKPNSIRRLVQLLASLSFVAPLQVFLLVSTLTVLNSKATKNFANILASIRQGLKSKYLKILTSSWISTSVLVSFAQNFIEPEKWSIFFSFAYAMLGTAQNIYFKLKSEPLDKQDK